MSRESNPVEALPESQAPTALSLCGTGVILYEVSETATLALVPTRCHRWDCKSCRTYRALVARDRARAGRPERLITLTLRPRGRETLAEQIDYVRQSWRRLVQTIRRNHGDFEWFASLELQKNGTPHLHILSRGSFIDQKWLSKAWRSLTGSYIVHITKINHTSGAVDEVTKYVIKTASQMQTDAPGRPVYTMSRHWLPPDFNLQDDKPPPDPYATHFPISFHDALWVIETLGGCLTHDPVSPGSWKIDFARPPTDEDLEALHMPPDERSYAFAVTLVWKLSPSPEREAAVRDELQHMHGITCKAWADPKRPPWLPRIVGPLAPAWASNRPTGDPDPSPVSSGVEILTLAQYFEEPANAY